MKKLTKREKQIKAVENVLMYEHSYANMNFNVIATKIINVLSIGKPKITKK